MQRSEPLPSWVVTFGYALAVLLPILGLIYGLAILARGDEHGADGAKIIVLALLAPILIAAVVAGALLFNPILLLGIGLLALGAFAFLAWWRSRPSVESTA
jgi:hypothetical protein